MTKVQRICWCVQCEELLPSKCEKCIKHPDRKPRIVEVYGAPPIIETNKCGCVGFKCQRNACTNPDLVWRHPKADGTLGFKNHFCSPACVRAVTSEAHRACRVEVPCDCGCGRICMRRKSELRSKGVYFSQLCHYRHRLEVMHEKRAKKVAIKTLWCFKCIAEVDHSKLPNDRFECVRCRNRTTVAMSEEKRENDTSVGFMWCATCRDTMEHKTPSKGDATCKVCGARKSQYGTAVSGTEALMISNANKRAGVEA